MHPAVQSFEKSEINRLSQDKTIPEFFAGDTLVVQLKIGERISNYTGICTGRRNRGLGSSFIVEKNSFGEKVRRVFLLYSPSIVSISVTKRGKVRRAKLNYLKYRSSKESRIAEAKSGYKAKLIAQEYTKKGAKK